MKKLLLMFLAIALVAGTAQATNLLPNAGFEVGADTLPDGWMGASYNGGVVAMDILWMDDPAGAHSGDKYMKLLTNNGSEPYLWPVDMVPVTAGETYDFSVWAKSTNGDATPPTRTEAFICFYKADFGDLFSLSPKWQLSPADEQWPTEWTKWDICTWTAPAEAAYVDFNLVTWEGNQAGTGLCYDDAMMTPEPLTISLLGLGGLMIRRRRKA